MGVTRLCMAIFTRLRKLTSHGLNTNCNAPNLRERSRSKHVEPKKRRKPKPRGQLVARSMRGNKKVSTTRSKPKPPLGQTTESTMGTKLVHRKNVVRLAKRSKSVPADKQNITEDLQKRSRSTRRSMVTNPSAENTTRVVKETENPLDKKRKKLQRELKMIDALSPNVGVKDDRKRSTIRVTRGQKPVSSPGPSSVAKDVEWPSLAEASQRKGLIKNAATEIVKNKRARSVVRTAKQMLTSITKEKSATPVSVSPAKGRATQTWANIVQNRSVLKTKQPHSTQATTSAVDGPTQTVKEVQLTPGRTVKMEPTTHAGKSEKNDGENTKSVKRKHSPEHADIIYQDQPPTSTDNDGTNVWSIDHMHVIYTRPARSIILLNDYQIDEKLPQKVNRNRCNNRQLSLADFMPSTSSQAKQRDVPLESNEPQIASGTDLCRLLDNISLPSENDHSDAHCNSPKQRQGSASNSSSGVNNSRPRRREITKQQKIKRQLATRTSQADGATKKVSLRYRALVRGEEAVLNAKPSSDTVTRTKRTNSMLEDTHCTRKKAKKLIKAKQQKARNARKSPALLVEYDKSTDSLTDGEMAQPSTSSNPNANNSFLQQITPTSLDFSTTNQQCLQIECVEFRKPIECLPIDTDTLLQDDIKAVALKDIDIDLQEDIEPVAFEYLDIDKILQDDMQPVAFEDLDIDAFLQEEPVPCKDLDVDWWNSYLFSDDTVITEGNKAAIRTVGH